MKCEPNPGELILKLEKLAKNMMNEKRSTKALLFLEMLSELFLEDDLVRGFFRNIRNERNIN